MNILDKIYQDKLIEVRNNKKLLSTKNLCAKINCQNNNIRNFAETLKKHQQENKIAIIAEVKKASPSKGIIKENFNHLEIARIYEDNGAVCLSVLTDEKYFLGKKEYLTEIRQITNLPILRKDFIIDEYQIYESKLIGADCVLLIMAMLKENQAINLEKAAIDSGLGVLIEIHNEDDLNKALKLKSPLIGINNRDLKDFKVSLNISRKLAPKIPQDKIIICESGISDKKDIKKIQQLGINNFLIGEYLIKQNNIGQYLQDLLT